MTARTACQNGPVSSKPYGAELAAAASSSRGCGLPTAEEDFQARIEGPVLLHRVAGARNEPALRAQERGEPIAYALDPGVMAARDDQTGQPGKPSRVQSGLARIAQVSRPATDPGR